MEVEEGGEEERMASGSRLPTSKERENNKRRERRRRAIAAKIYAGLRMYGNYKLPKHCDNNEVLKALCREAGWVVEEDGSTYREGCKPTDLKEIASTSTSPSPSSSYQPSPASSSYIVNAPSEVNTMPPFLSDLTPLSSSKAPPLHCHRHQHLHLLGGSISAPVTPPLSSPSARSPRMKMTYWDDLVAPRLWYPPSSSSHHFLPGGPSTPSISLVSSYDFGGFSSVALVPPAEFVFGAGRSSSKEEVSPAGPVKAWAGEKIHEECGTDELELTLGGSKRSNA